MAVVKEFDHIKEIRGVFFPKYLDEHKLIVTGPPGSGKSTILGKIRGWSEEGYVDITYRNWWKLPLMTYRPRELHFGLPLVNQRKALAIYEITTFEEELAIDFARIQLPPRKKGLFSLNWSRRIVFEFLLPPAEILFEYRAKRAEKGTHHVDVDLTLDKVQREVDLYKELALFFHRSGLLVYIRDNFVSKPKHFTEPVSFKNPTLFKAVLNVGKNANKVQSHKW